MKAVIAGILVTIPVPAEAFSAWEKRASPPYRPRKSSRETGTAPQAAPSSELGGGGGGHSFGFPEGQQEESPNVGADSWDAVLGSATGDGYGQRRSGAESSSVFALDGARDGFVGRNSSGDNAVLGRGGGGGGGRRSVNPDPGETVDETVERAFHDDRGDEDADDYDDDGDCYDDVGDEDDDDYIDDDADNADAGITRENKMGRRALAAGRRRIRRIPKTGDGDANETSSRPPTTASAAVAPGIAGKTLPTYDNDDIDARPRTQRPEERVKIDDRVSTVGTAASTVAGTGWRELRRDTVTALVRQLGRWVRDDFFLHGCWCYSTVS